MHRDLLALQKRDLCKFASTSAAATLNTVINWVSSLVGLKQPDFDVVVMTPFFTNIKGRLAQLCKVSPPGSSGGDVQEMPVYGKAAYKLRIQKLMAEVDEGKKSQPPVQVPYSELLKVGRFAWLGDADDQAALKLVQGTIVAPRGSKLRTTAAANGTTGTKNKAPDSMSSGAQASSIVDMLFSNKKMKTATSV